MGRSSRRSIDRRALLGTLAAGVAAGSSGCLRRAQSITGWEGMTQVSLTLKTLPADADPYALKIAQQLAGWYQAAGIDAEVTPMAEKQLLRQVLLNNEFDVFVTRGEDRFQDPDTLYALLHSQFASAPGWQNPFGYANLDVDELLDTQRRSSGTSRRSALMDLQRTVARSQPFSVVAFPADIRTAASRNFTNWQAIDLRSPRGYLALEQPPDGDGEGDERSPLRVAMTDRRATENLNPLSVEYRRSGVLTGLLYDPLCYARDDGTLSPWIAESWRFSTGEKRPVATVNLRSDLRWHDGDALTAQDVAFTYALLADTTLGERDRSTTDTATDTENDARTPAPRFQGRADLVSDVKVRDETTVTVEFIDCSPQVATRAFTVPILPEHVWTDRTEQAAISGIQFGPATEALVTNNIPPVGSGPLQFVRNTPRESLVLEQFDEHFLTRDGTTLPEDTNPPSFDRFVVRVVGTDETAVEMVADGDADVTGTPVTASTVPRIGRADALNLLVNAWDTPYVVGYNAQRPPLTNPRFRHTLGRLVDKSHLVETVFDGYARPAASLLAGTDWLAPDLEWDDTDPVTPFLGTDGDLDVPRTREAFRAAGFQYEDTNLVRGG